MFCSQCGSSLDVDSKLCPSCGAAVRQKVSGETRDADPAIPPAKKRRWLPFAVAGGVLVVVGLAFSLVATGVVRIPGQAGDSLVGDGGNSPSAASSVAGIERVSSCNEPCHTPMDPYVQTADQQLGEQGVDKWGNSASTRAMLSVTHGSRGFDCQACHRLTDARMDELADDWATGNYVPELEERDLYSLVEDQSVENEDSFCLNENCHDLSRGDLIAATSGGAVNPHDATHGEISCGECHKSHRASVNYCKQCHDDAEIPEGWLSPGEAMDLLP